MDDANLQELTQCERLLVVTSTYGEGEMPDNAQALWDEISDDSAPSFANSYYSVLALGDTNYDGFCTAGILWDERLQALGAQRVTERVDCDVDYEEPANQWLNEALATIAQKGSSVAGDQQSSSVKKAAKSKFNRQNPLSAELITKKQLTQAGSSKETFHYEFSLEESGETYEAGDALNVVSSNRDELVDELLALFNTSGDLVEPYKGESLTLTDIFTNILEIRTPSKELIAELALRSGDEKLASLVNDSNKEPLNNFLWGKDTTDLLKLYPQAQFSIAEFIALSKPLAARAYSISSSIKHHAQEVHLTVANVRYTQNDRDHHGVCSTFLADKAAVGDKIKCFFSPNKSFSVPQDTTAPMIMVGPGTGIAPFRAFLEERVATKAQGDNWLFFGDRNSETDFLYQDEIETMQSSGLLTRLDLAFSRDQSEKIYVQDRMLENAKELFAWLERGAYFFICGDAYHMAKDVDKALHTIIEQQGGLSAQASEEYVNQLKKQKRYVRDVY
jgi:sulfite reductase (NADPH) flavoprotein alpha-component